MLHCLEHLYADSGFHWGGRFFFDIAFLLLTTVGERRLLHWGVSFAGLNTFWNPTTTRLIILTIFIFIFILIFSILIILIIPIVFIIILLILSVFIIIVIN